MSNLTTRIPQLLAAAACAVALVGAASPAMAGRGGSYAAVQNAINTNSKDAIIAELERSEFLICDRCIAPVMDLLDDDRYAVREVAAWWFARRPVIAAQLVERSYADLEGSDSRLARNAADILGTFRDPDALPALEAAVTRTTLSAEARTAVVRAIGTIGNARGSDALAAAMGDSDASVRHEALVAWIAIRRQRGAAPAVALVADP
ncbi:MAG: HEAT repeat domain-containing protein, partial [Myxococcales bacterium]|nr:HEAT repeat domain-containing protein [Myxococcales bacterium]